MATVKNICSPVLNPVGRIFVSSMFCTSASKHVFKEASGATPKTDHTLTADFRPV